MKKIMVVVKKVGEEPKRVLLRDELHIYQKYVGGYIEFIYLENNVAIIVNEEGKFNLNCKPNVLLPHLNDVAFGDIVFVAVNDEEGDCCNLTKEQLIYVLEYVKKNNITDENRDVYDFLR